MNIFKPKFANTVPSEPLLFRVGTQSLFVIGVTQEITDLMSENVSVLFKSNIGISLTGYASAIPEQGIFEKFAFASISFNGSWIFSDRFTTSKTFQSEVKMDFATQAIRECSRYPSSPVS